MICDCSANYGKECLFPEEYNTVGCTSGDEGCWEIVDYYEDEEYGSCMKELENILLRGNGE